MRALAEYVMRGRTQAVIAVVLATGTVFFAWVGAAVIALVTLRKGTAQGAYVLFWGLIPATFLAAIGDISPITSLLGATMVAVVLRVTASWSWALMTAVISGALTAMILLTIGSGYIELMMQLLNDMFAEIAKQSEVATQQPLTDVPGEFVTPANMAQAANEIVLPTAQQIAGLMGLTNTLSAIMCLMLARWWQALLFNPGGFRAEFHSLRLKPQLTIVLLAMGLSLSLLGPDYSFLAIIFAVPFIFAGFALVHGLAGQRQIKGNWLGLVYCGWLIFAPIKALILILAVVDSWMDFRKRFAVNRSDNGHDN